jgi:tetratricopeptide (TPR) repeat protein
MISIIAFVISVLSVLTIAVVLALKIPRLRVIDVSSIPQEKTRVLKEKLIMEKLTRVGRSKLGVVARASAVAARGASRVGRRAVQRLYAIEQYYQKLNRIATEGQYAYSQETIKKLTDDAEKLIREEEYIPAEKIYIDIISHNPKNVGAYEGLGNMYLDKGEFDQAKETFRFTLRLSPNDASVNVSMAELERKLNNPKAALEYLRKAVGKRSKNPKYLDFYIEAGFAAGSLKDIRNGITLLQKVNPENQKIAEFEERFQKLKDEYIAKTSQSE